MSIITEQLNDIVVKSLTRATIVDGKLLQYYVVQPLNQRDEFLAQYFDVFDKSAYHNDLANNIYHFDNNQKDYNVNIFSDTSAYNVVTNNLQNQTLTAVSTTANSISSTNYTTTSLSSTSFSATNDFYVNMTGIGLTNKEKFVDVVDFIHDRADEVNDYISNNEIKWSSISAIRFISNGTTSVLHPNVLKMKHDSSVIFNNANNLLTIGVTEAHSNASVSNGVLNFV